MRYGIAVTAAIVLAALAADAARADPVSIPVQTSGPNFNENLSVVIPPFDGAVPLTSETFTLTGTYTPAFVWSADTLNGIYPRTVPITLTGKIGVLAKQLSTLSAENLLATYDPVHSLGYTATGAAEAFAVTGTITASNSEFGQRQIDLWAYTVPSLHFPYGTPLADLGTLDATLTVAYNDPPAADPPASVPEPASVALLAAGLLGIGAMRVKRDRPPLRG